MEKFCIKCDITKGRLVQVFQISSMDFVYDVWLKKLFLQSHTSNLPGIPRGGNYETWVWVIKYIFHFLYNYM